MSMYLLGLYVYIGVSLSLGCMYVCMGLLLKWIVCMGVSLKGVEAYESSCAHHRGHLVYS